VVGTGAPGAALASLREGIEVIGFDVVRDHQPISDRVRELLEHWPVVTTAKDAARLPAPLRARVAWREVVLTGDWPAEVDLPPAQALR
jgi:tetraacyldisaccharide-1-P 4'-kinase